MTTFSDVPDGDDGTRGDPRGDTGVDPRAARSRQAITEAARRLLLDHGPAAVTHVRVAEVAGVGRATVYRHWPRSDQLLAEAMATVPLPFFETPPPHGGAVRGWLLAELTSLARQLDLADVRAVATTLASAAPWNADVEARRAGFAGLLTDRVGTALRAAADAGEVALSCPGEDAAAALIGPLYYRATIERAPIGDGLVRAAVDAVGTWRD